MTEHSRSYYEIALSNRQVLVAFVILLVCLVAAFFSGVWIGRGGAMDRPAVAQTAADGAGSDGTLEDRPFFAEEPEPRRLEELATSPSAETTLAEDLGVERRAVPEAPKPAPAAGELVVQVFSSGDEGQAGKVKDRLVAGGYPAFVSPTNVDGQRLYRVRIGPYRDEAAAKSVAEKVGRTFSLETWITR